MTTEHEQLRGMDAAHREAWFNEHLVESGWRIGPQLCVKVDGQPAVCGYADELSEMVAGFLAFCDEPERDDSGRYVG